MAPGAGAHVTPCWKKASRVVFRHPQPGRTWAKLPPQEAQMLDPASKENNEIPITGAGSAMPFWPETEEVYARLARLTRTPMRPLRRDRVAAHLQTLNGRGARSRALAERARRCIPGGVQHNLAFNYPFPLAIERADGPYLWDVDGNRYIDFLQAGGPGLLGNNYPPVRDAVIDVLRACGPATGMFHEYEVKLAELVARHVPSVEAFRMLGSGTEACMAALRAARTFTGKNKVIKEGGAYHGWSDQLVFGLHLPGTGPFEAHGIPGGCLQGTQEFFPGLIDSPHGLRALLEQNAREGGTAAVLLEPVGPESGTRPVRPGFLPRVRQLCDEFGALLVFDEVVTGFRMGLGGAQGLFGVKPDLTVFGKCVAGGYPAAGGLGGRREVMSTLAAGIEAGKARAYVGGTLSANPMSCVAGYHAICAMETTDAAGKAARASARLCQGLDQIIRALDLPFVAYQQGSICHLETGGALLVDVRAPNALAEAQARKTMMEEMSAAYCAEGIITVAGSRIYTSMADTDAVIDDALAAFERVFAGVEGVRAAV
jgi:glutamate-1-semialdehyde 2,1-aminomutase